MELIFLFDLSVNIFINKILTKYKLFSFVQQQKKENS
jgi:hypothetical protein